MEDLLGALSDYLLQSGFQSDMWYEMPDGERMMRISEVAQLLRMSDKTIRRMIDAGQLASVKIRGLRLIRWTDLQHLIKSPV